MLSKVHRKNLNELFETPIVQQTAFWSQVKKKLGFISMAFDFKVDSNIIYSKNNQSPDINADLLIINQQLDANHSIAYVPYGPELEPDEDNKGCFLEELSECIRPWLPKDVIAIRYDLLWESFWARSQEFNPKEGNWIGPPNPAIAELRFNCNTINWKLKKAYTNILPSNTIFLNLKNSEETILSSMKPKTRYNIKISYKKGVQVRTLATNELDLWYQLYTETAKRNRFHLHNINYFKAMLDSKKNEPSSGTNLFVLMAHLDEIPLAAMFLVISKNRSTYLYGASSDKNKNFMGSYALQWHAILKAKQMGCTEYDMFGIAPTPDPTHPMFGLYRFKTGFGGEIFHGLGTWDYFIDEKKYQYFSSVERTSGGYHLSTQV